MIEQEKKKENKANETYRAHEANEANGAYRAYGPQPQRKALEPRTFLPKKGNYRGLLVYQKAECLYDITFYFAHHYFVERKDRTIDQVVQAARSGKQNIAEGCAAASTSAETELKLLGVARASMQETLLDYEDYLRTRGLEQWAVNDPRTQQIQEYSKTHNRPEDYTKDIDKRSPEALCNIAITLIHQFDNMMGRLLDRLQKDFVEEGGIRERMTAARLGYRNEQKARIAELETENRTLKARIAELEQNLKKLIGPMSLLIGLMGQIGRMGLMSLIGPIGLIGLMGLMGLGLMGCSGSGGDAVGQAPTPPPTEVAISFSGAESQEEAVNNGANRAYGPYRRAAGTPLSESATTFHVWGYKNMDYNDGTGAYGGTQIVFPGYQVEWHDGTASTTTTNSSGWEYILPAKSDQTIKYWDWGAKAYRYFAVTGELNGANGPHGPNESNGAYYFTIAANASNADAMNATPYFTRLWFSTGNQVAYPDKQFGKPVTLEFVKPYTRVRFQFKYSYPREGIKLTEKSFKPTDDVTAAEETKVKIARKGTVTVHYPIEGTATKEWYSVVVDNDKSTRLEALTIDYDPDDDGKDYTGTDKGWYMVLPRDAQGSYTLSVKVNGQARTAVVPAEYMQWLPGYSYTYIFKITEEGGVEVGWVEYAVVPWIEMFANKTVYNW